MTESSYLFYDLETTGLNFCFDQVLQFAAIRTDLELNELERHEYQIKLNPDIIPSPYAILTHRQGINSMLEKGESEYEIIIKIHQLLNQPGTISLGYNTLGFDDEFLRFSFYRNLLPPYTHQYANNCSRMDIYPITLLYYLFSPDSLTWPKVNGNISLKLENLNQANQLASGMAHDAMVDVDTTVALARKLKDNNKMWAFCCGYFNKSTDLDRLNELNNGNNQIHDYPLAYLVEGKLGQKNSFMAPVLGLGPHKVYKNQTLWLRLDAQPEILANTSAEELYLVNRRKSAEQKIILPYHERYTTHIKPERQTLIAENIRWCKDNPVKLKGIQQYQQHYTYPAIKDIDADAALYQLPFAARAESQRMNQFHAADLTHKSTITKQFSTPTYQQLALRLINKYDNTNLSDAEKTAFQEHINTIYQQAEYPKVDYRQRQKLTAHRALDDIKTIKSAQQLNQESLQLLTEFESYLHQQR
jgi:exodeoxyribonuclease I